MDMRIFIQRIYSKPSLDKQAHENETISRELHLPIHRPRPNTINWEAVEWFKSKIRYELQPHHGGMMVRGRRARERHQLLHITGGGGWLAGVAKAVAPEQQSGLIRNALLISSHYTAGGHLYNLLIM